NGDPIGRASVAISGKGLSGREKLGNHVFTMLEGTTGKPSRFTPKHEEARWMRVTSEGKAVDADTLASRLQFSPDFADKLANELSLEPQVSLRIIPPFATPPLSRTCFQPNSTRL